MQGGGFKGERQGKKKVRKHDVEQQRRFLKRTFIIKFNKMIREKKDRRMF